MRITGLVENEPLGDTLGAEHGLSLYIETENRSLLFDMGKGNMFLRNADALGVSIPGVDLAVVSHGHYDHGGGLGAFLQRNGKAPVFIRRSAFEPHLSRRANDVLADIGLDTALLSSERLRFTEEREKIGDGMTLFSNVTERDYFSGCNDTILMRRGETLLPDDFTHEQNLLIGQGGLNVLVAGCAHCGIVNILRRAERELGCMPDVVIGGFHLSSASRNRVEPEERIRAIGNILYESGAVYYTGHCTGSVAFKLLKGILKERLQPLHAGTIIDL